MITLIAFTTFMGIVWWAYSPSRKAALDEQARIPFDEPDEGGPR